MAANDYCATCGDCIDGADHVCPCADAEPQWCHDCGAELMDTGSCDNEHPYYEDDEAINDG